MLERLAYQTDANGTVLATFTDDSAGVPVSVQVGSDPNTAPRSYYVCNGHGDVVALVDAQGNAVASYGYDAFGLLTSDTESFASGWSNPSRYDGRDSVRGYGPAARQRLRPRKTMTAAGNSHHSWKPVATASAVSASAATTATAMVQSSPMMKSYQNAKNRRT